MKTKKLVFLLCMLFSMWATNALAYDFAVKNSDGVMIYYNYNSSKTGVYVTYKAGYVYKNDNSYSGSITIPKEITCENKTIKVTGIGEHAFQVCHNLTSITIPNSVTSIDESAFEDCSKLTSVTIPNSVTSIGDRAFIGCTSLKTVTIPNSVTTIGIYAFQSCSSLTSVTIPNSVKSIGEYAFSLCKNLNSVKIPNSVKSIEYATFWGCSSLTSVTILNSVKGIGVFAFSECGSLKSVTIPNSVTTIGEGAFDDCGSLASVTIPNSVTTIGDGAFDDCVSLTSITIPSSVKNIGIYAFEGCSNLKKIVSKIAKPFAIETNTFLAETYSKATLYVPKGIAAKYKATDSWKVFKNILEEGSGTTTGIDDVVAQDDIDAVTIKAEGGQLTVAGAADNTAVAVYALDGAHLGSTFSKNGIAVVNTNGANSTVIVRVGNKSKKIVIK